MPGEKRGLASDVSVLRESNLARDKELHTNSICFALSMGGITFRIQQPHLHIARMEPTVAIADLVVCFFDNCVII